jgi:uridylate kinase
MRVVVSIGGSVLAPTLDASHVEAYASIIEELVEAGCELAAVVGGGGVARQYIEVARTMDANEVQLDQLGIDVTRINARLLIAALGSIVDPKVAETYEDAGDVIRRGDVAIMGGVMPGQTTDAVAAALAEYIDAELLVYATSVDGVYDADPSSGGEARKLERLSPTELVDIIVPMSRDAGASAPVDLLAAKLIERAGMRSIVLDGTDPSRIATAILTGDHSGTDIVCADDPIALAHW